jgi:2-dehydro-3-deoxyphosphogalactonate aldolase
MQIKDVETFVVGIPPPYKGGRYWAFVKLVADDGVVGYGEAYDVPFHADAVVRLIEDMADRIVIGFNPFKIEKFWRRLYSSAAVAAVGAIAANPRLKALSPRPA